MTDFVSKYLGFENISREDIIENHTTVFARELLASGSYDTAILLLDGTYIYIQNSSKYTFQMRSYSVYKGCPLVKPLTVESFNFAGTNFRGLSVLCLFVGM